jgi:hypothetical protein
MPVDWSVYGMNQSLRAAFIATLLLGTGCSGGGGFLGTNYNPKGDITITNPTTGAVLVTSASSPYFNTTGDFLIGIAETNFGGPYNVTVTNWNNGFNKPCFVPTLVDTTDHINTVLFKDDNANPVGTPVTTPNPCTLNDGDLETASIGDGKGHTVYFYYYFGSSLPAALKAKLKQ